MKNYIIYALHCCLFIIFSCFFSATTYAAILKENPNDPLKGEATEKWEISEAFQYQKGKFGTDDVTKIYEYDTAIERFFEKGDITLTIPYIKQRSPNSVILIEKNTLNESLGTEKRVSDGIGDVTIDASYYLLTEDNKTPLDVTLYGHLKFPTASKRKGLGTHEFDGGPGLGLSRRFLSKWRAFSDFYFSYIGNIPGTYFQDELRFDYGIEYQFTSKLSLNISYEQSNALVKLTPDPRDIALNLNYKLNNITRLFGNYSFGLSDGSPAQSIQIGVGIGF